MLTCTGNPFVDGVEATRRFESDAMIVIDAGRIVEAGPARAIAAKLPPHVPVERMPRRTLIVASSGAVRQESTRFDGHA